MNTPPKLNAAALVAIRVRMGITRAKLATDAELDRSQLWRIETGRATAPRDDTVRRLADALGVPVSALLDNESSAA